MKKVIFQEPVWADSQLVPLKTSVSDYVKDCRAANTKPVWYQIGILQYGADGKVAYLPSPPDECSFSKPLSIAQIEKKYAPRVVYFKRRGALLRCVIGISLAQRLKELAKEWPFGFGRGGYWVISGDDMKDVQVSNEVLLAWAGIKNKKITQIK